MDFFVSYAHEDKDRVRPFVLSLKELGRTVFWDPDLRVGLNWRSRLTEEHSDSDCVVVFWSSHSIKSDWVIDEANAALSEDKLFPVVIDEGCSVPARFGATQYIDLSKKYVNEKDRYSEFSESAVQFLRSKSSPKDRLSDLKRDIGFSLDSNPFVNAIRKQKEN